MATERPPCDSGTHWVQPPYLVRLIFHLALWAVGLSSGQDLSGGEAELGAGGRPSKWKWNAPWALCVLNDPEQSSEVKSKTLHPLTLSVPILVWEIS